MILYSAKIKKHRNELFSLSIRILGLIGKFFLLIYIARYFTVETLGVYGLFVASLTYALYFVGADFYTYSSRLILASPSDKWPFFITNQFAFYFLSYVVVAIVVLPILYWVDLDRAWMGWFYILLFSENFSQEFFRLLIILKLPLQAHTVAFFRMGAWVYVLLAFWELGGEEKSMTDIFLFWSVFNFISIAVGVYWVQKNTSAFSHRSLSYRWILEGMLVARSFLIHTAAWRAIFSLDRYLILFFQNEFMVGVYTFYSGFSNTLLTFLDTGVISQDYPTFVQMYQTNAPDKLVARQKLTTKIGIYSVVFSLIILAATFVVVTYFTKTIYAGYFYLLPILLVANIFQTYSMIPHFILYALGKDLQIARLSIITLLVFIIAGTLLSSFLAYSAIPLALLISFIFVFLAKNRVADRLNVHQ